ncbi:hypothetical protein NMY22_g8912 [Coprinellus aureogranulatus]|nr:hypothetical protein NMY22_g8912 [Coprinellus aureogranulatus]
MKTSSLFTVCATAVAVSAQSVSVFLPIFESQPITADVAGINTNGDTTYILRASETGFLEFSGTATLVQGPTGASFGAVLPTASSGEGITLGYACNFENNQAECTG